MTREDLQSDLDYVTRTLRRRERPAGVPAIYFLWAALVLVGFALPDWAPRLSGPYWLIAGLGGGALSLWLGARDSRRSGVIDRGLARRYGYHWLVASIAFALTALPIALGRFEVQTGVANFLLTAGTVYALAGVHLDRPILWSGLVMYVAYAAIVLFSPPYIWTLAGVATSAALAWAGWSTLSQRKAAATA
ncbi:hypothetical protein [Lysobacter silvisoli]|uniref:Uncharacterized protein n=1 Tax=Lysobacter silvisoli TaxID=2293254 RepID=A0A371K0E7_9GAMM|nr:hypothetical protein [Lysobacter silvisoli]RDZ27330.1 hypothetical protein DX914_13915 [Lysobacter silvisoli]